MAYKFMSKQDESNDLDQLIDRAVDTFFVEAPTTAEENLATSGQSHPASAQNPSTSASKAPSFEEAVDTLFMTAFKGTAPTVTSGDQETDWAIDLAVDTLFVEQPETPPPETTQLDVRVAESGAEEERFTDYQQVRGTAEARPEPAARPSPAAPDSATAASPHSGPSYDDVVASEISRHMHTLFEETVQAEQRVEQAPVNASQRVTAARKSSLHVADKFPLRKLQETILTLEWEISKRSVSALAHELQRVRARFQDNVTVDFAALAMKVVLEYIVKRMSRAHPQSVRFLMEVTDYLDRKLSSSEDDPLVAFHQIVTRYEKYKSAVRKAEGLSDRRPPILSQLEVKDADTFSRLVERHATTIAKAGRSLAKRLGTSGDPENLIRSFRFLVSRSVNRILQNTLKEDARKLAGKQTTAKRG
ncbi:MAG: hypothetical protein WBG50_27205 [Desulfomonilaceae bacterium]